MSTNKTSAVKLFAVAIVILTVVAYRGWLPDRTPCMANTDMSTGGALLPVELDVLSSPSSKWRIMDFGVFKIAKGPRITLLGLPMGGIWQRMAPEESAAMPNYDNTPVGKPAPRLTASVKVVQ